MVYLASLNCSKVYNQLNLSIEQLKRSKTLAGFFDVPGFTFDNEGTQCIINSTNLAIIEVIANILYYYRLAINQLINLNQIEIVELLNLLDSLDLINQQPVNLIIKLIVKKLKESSIDVEYQTSLKD